MAYNFNIWNISFSPGAWWLCLLRFRSMGESESPLPPSRWRAIFYRCRCVRRPRLCQCHCVHINVWLRYFAKITTANHILTPHYTRAHVRLGKIVPGRINAPWFWQRYARLAHCITTFARILVNCYPPTVELLVEVWEMVKIPIVCMMLVKLFYIFYLHFTYQSSLQTGWFWLALSRYENTRFLICHLFPKLLYLFCPSDCCCFYVYYTFIKLKLERQDFISVISHFQVDFRRYKRTSKNVYNSR